MAGYTIAEALDRIYDAWNTGNVDQLDDVIAPDVQYHIQTFPDMDLAGLKPFILALRTSSPDFKVWENERIAEGNEVCSRWTCTASFTAENPNLPGVPPTGKSQTSWGFASYRFEGGKLAEVWHAWDGLGWFTQQGIIPAMG
jgi:predicted ester cyclase